MYIHLNPFKARLSKDIFSYKWSSLDVYIKPVDNSFLHPEEVLNLLSNKGDGRFLYKELMSNVASLKFDKAVDNKNAVEELIKKLTRLFRKSTKDNLWSNSAFLKSFIDDEERERYVIGRKRRVQPEAKEAFFYCVQQLKAQGYTYAEIAERLKVNRATIYRLLHSNAPKLFETKMVR